MLESYIVSRELQEYYFYIRDFFKKTLFEDYQNTEIVIPEEVLYNHIQALIDFGLIFSDRSGEDELSIWNYYRKDPESFLYSIICLIELGTINGSLGYISHQYSLSAYCKSFIKERYNKTLDYPFFLQLQGNYGLGRDVVASFIFSQSLENLENKESLQEYFHFSNPIVMQIPDFIKRFAFFSVNSDRLSFHLAEILNKKSLYPSHGFDEIPTFEIFYKEIDNFTIEKELYIDLFTKQILGNIAISIGRLIYAFQKGWKYSQERSQGGNYIIEYPAIQNLLFNANSIIEIAINSTFYLMNCTSQIDLLLKSLKIKKIIMPLLVQGISDCLQVHGGYGYMKDYGIEKAYRDANHLKQLLGTSYEISIFLSKAYGVMNNLKGVTL